MPDYSNIIIEDDGQGGIARFTRADHFNSGETGAAVEQLNAFLIAAGFLTEEELAKQGGRTDLVGTGTKNAVIYFMREMGLEVDDNRNEISADELRAMRSFLQEQGLEPNAEMYTGNEGGRALIDDFGPTDQSAVADDRNMTTDPPNPNDPIQPDGEGDTPGMLSGGQVYRVRRAGQEDFWVHMYEWPPGSGKFMAFQYDSPQAMRAAVGQVPVTGISENQFYNVATIAGNASELVGQSGSFNLMMEDVMRDAAADAGINDPTLLGQYLADPEIQQILAQAAVGEWSEAETLAALRQATFYTDVLYPGIETFYDRTDNPEAAWRLYQQNVAANLEQLGVPRDADGTYKSTIGVMLQAGVTDTEFAQFTPTYIKAANNDVYRQNLNQWLGAAGLNPVDDFNSFFDVLAGTTTPEVQEIVELAGLSFAAENQGVDISQELFQELAAKTDLTEQQVTQAFSELDRSLIALGDAGLAGYGLSTRDILLARSGVAPGDGRSVGQIDLLIEKAAQERGRSDDPTASFYTEYNSEGAPYKAGLRSTVGEGA